MTDTAPPLVFADIEVLGLEVGCPIWEFAAIRTHREGIELARDAFFLRHSQTGVDAWLSKLPDSFAADYRARYDHAAALLPWESVPRIAAITKGGVKLVGSNPAFDAAHLEPLMRHNGYEPTWHYHPLDIPSMILGVLAAQGRLAEQTDWRSDALSRAIGVDPDDYDRHTAMGDAAWTLAQWRAATNAVRQPTFESWATGESVIR